ncbi:MAG: serine hydrolase, partial [Chloroflexota bacterium]|nr:serine hydrolase [Chloroflexota bacterium]
MKLRSVSAIQRFTTAVLPLVVIAGFLVLFSSACSQPETTPPPGAQEIKEQSAYWPVQDWRTSTPEEQGMDSEVLNQMVALIDQQDYAYDSLLVVRNGRIVFEQYFNRYDQNVAHHLQSATKSFSSMLIGIAIQEGFIQNVDQKMVELFPEHIIANMDTRKVNITLEHLLTMSEGMDWHELEYPYNDPRNTLGQMWVSSDAVQHVLDQPMAREPGESWAYNSGTSILLGGILEGATGQDVLDFAREYLFDPIGIGNVRWDKTTGDHYHTDGGLYMTPRDMARFGYLMLHNGDWDGKEIVSPEWVARSTEAH